MPAYRILLAEDDDGHRETLSELLSRLGFGVVEAVDGISALEIARCVEVSFSILDFHMPGLTGLEVLKALRCELPSSKERGSHPTGMWPQPAALPCILLSAHASPQERQEALRQGAFRFLMKPISVDQLFESVDELMRSYFPEFPQSSFPSTLHGIGRTRQPGISGLPATLASFFPPLGPRAPHELESHEITDEDGPEPDEEDGFPS